jgi:hypothetical protein
MLLQDNILTNVHWVPFTPRRGTAGAARRERVELVDEHEVIGVIEQRRLGRRARARLDPEDLPGSPARHDHHPTRTR